MAYLHSQAAKRLKRLKKHVTAQAITNPAINKGKEDIVGSKLCMMYPTRTGGIHTHSMGVPNWGQLGMLWSANLGTHASLLHYADGLVEDQAGTYNDNETPLVKCAWECKGTLETEMGAASMHACVWHALFFGVGTPPEVPSHNILLTAVMRTPVKHKAALHRMIRRTSLPFIESLLFVTRIWSREIVFQVEYM